MFSLQLPVLPYLAEKKELLQQKQLDCYLTAKSSKKTLQTHFILSELKVILGCVTWSALMSDSTAQQRCVLNQVSLLLHPQERATTCHCREALCVSTKIKMLIEAKREQGARKKELELNGLKRSFGEIHERKVDCGFPSASGAWLALFLFFFK